MDNYIGLNISKLVSCSNLTKEAFGRLFELKRGAISSYIDGKALPKIETLQKISAHYHISIDDLVNRDIENFTETGKGEMLLSGEEKTVSGVGNCLECEKLKEKIDLLEQVIEAKSETIKALQSKDSDGSSKRQYSA